MTATENMTKVNTVLVVRMTSGIEIISSTLGEMEEYIILDYPLEMSIIDDLERSVSAMYMNRFMPYANGDLVIVNKKNIESMSVCSKKYSDLYKNKVDAFKKAVDEMTKETESYTNEESVSRTKESASKKVLH